MDASEPRSKSSRLCVAAIELGPSSCTWGFSLKHSWKKILSPPTQYATSVLLNPDQTLNAFGDKANEAYNSLTEDSEEDCINQYYFPDFVGQMFENCTSGFKIQDINGKEVETDVLLYEILKFFTGQIMSTIGGKHLDIQDVDFVIVLPMTCNNEVTSFVERNALKAGIKQDVLSVVSDVVAASLFAQHADEDVWDPIFARGFQWSTLEEKDIYLTVHIGEEQTTIHKHLKHSKGIDPYIKRTTFPVGSNSILSEVLSFLKDALSTDVIEEFQRDFPEEYKSTIDEIMRSVMRVKMTTTILSPLKIITKRKWKKDMSTVLRNRVVDESITESSCKIKITEERIHRLCKSTLEKITKKIDVVMEQEGVENVKRVVFIGELGNSKLLHKYLRGNILKSSICIPCEASLVVLKGGVYYGHVDNTHNVVAKATLGIQVLRKFDPSKHPVESKVTMHEEEYYGGVCISFLEKGAIIQHKESITKRIQLPNPDNETCRCLILSSRRKIGLIDLPFPSPAENHVYEETEFTTKFDFSSLSVEAHHIYKCQSFKMSVFGVDCF